MLKAALIRKHVVDEGLDCESSYYAVETIAEVSSRQSAEDFLRNTGGDYIVIVDNSVRKGMLYDPEQNTITDLDGNVVYPPVSTAETIQRLQNEIAELTYNLDEEALTLDELKDYLIRKNKKNLADYLYNHPMTVDGKQYTITEEKQNQLIGMLNAYQYAKTIGVDLELTWNETGDICEPYTFEALVNIYLQMLAIVKPIVTYQQQVEIEIRNAETKEAAQAADINFDNYAVEA